MNGTGSLKEAELLWEDTGTDGRQRLTAIWRGNRYGWMLLRPCKKDVFTVEEIFFDRQASSEEQEKMMLCFVQEIRSARRYLLLRCRLAQQWFGSHPQQCDLLSGNIKTKPSF